MQHVEGFHHKRRSFTKEVTQGVLVAVALRQSGGRDAAFRALPEPTNPLGWWKVSNFTTHRQRSSAFTSRDTCSCSLWGHKWSMEKSLRYTHLYIYIRFYTLSLPWDQKWPGRSLAGWVESTEDQLLGSIDPLLWRCKPLGRIWSRQRGFPPIWSGTWAGGSLLWEPMLAFHQSLGLANWAD